MRIIAGAFKGRRLLTPDDQAIRPTSDRARQAIFNVLMHGQYAGRAVIEQAVADLCCGTGALGLEALSRGATRCTFVDQDKRALELTKKNAIHCGATQTSHFLNSDVAKLPATTHPVALVMMDAPYATPLLEPAYAALQRGGWFAPGALLVAELPHSAETPNLTGASLCESRRYGKAMIVIYRID